MAPSAARVARSRRVAVSSGGRAIGEAMICHSSQLSPRRPFQALAITPLIVFLPGSALPMPTCLFSLVERFNRSIQEECLDRAIPLGEAHLRELVREYVAHYHEERSHQGLSGRLIAAAADPRGRGPLARRQRLGGLLNHYYREAA